MSGWQPLEIVPDHPALFASLKRVQVTWPADGERRTWDDLAEEIQGTDQVLVVVNLKRHALALMEALGDTPDVVHLSTNLCPEHRRAVLDRVRASLHGGQPCRLISTQCVEAGVDLDFPRVYRALAPLEAIAQAAGRCNREGRQNAQGRLGEVIVFEPAGGRRAAALPDLCLLPGDRGHPHPAQAPGRPGHRRPRRLPRLLPAPLRPERPRQPIPRSLAGPHRPGLPRGRPCLSAHRPGRRPGSGSLGGSLRRLPGPARRGRKDRHLRAAGCAVPRAWPSASTARGTAMPDWAIPATLRRGGGRPPTSGSSSPGEHLPRHPRAAPAPRDHRYSSHDANTHP